LASSKPISHRGRVQFLHDGFAEFWSERPRGLFVGEPDADSLMMSAGEEFAWVSWVVSVTIWGRAV